MYAPRLRRTLMLALTLVAVAGCQAPGFMGLSGSATTPDSSSDASRLVRARFRVVVPAAFTQGLSVVPTTPADATRSGGSLDDRAVIGAKVYLDAQPNVTDTTDDLGMASLAVPLGRITPVRADFKTPSGPVSMTALIKVDSDAQSAPVFSITVASTLVMTKVAQRFSYSDLRYLPFDKIQSATVTVDQALRGPDGTFDPRNMPTLGRQWTVLDTAQAMVRLDPILTQALSGVLSTRIPVGDDPGATPSASVATASTRPVAYATRSVEATASNPASSSATASASAVASGSVAGDLSLFAGDLGQGWTYDLFDANNHAQGTMVRQVAKVSAKSSGVLIAGTESGSWTGDDRELRFLLRRSVSKVQVSAAYRPSVDYPLPMLDGMRWQAGPGITAVAHAPVATDDVAPWATSWRIDFTSVKDDQPQTWSEWLAPGVGYTRLQWFDPRTGQRWDARLHPKQEASPNP